MKFHIKLLIILLFILSTIFAQSNSNNNLLKKLDKFYQKTYDEWNVPGMSIAIVKDGKTNF